MPVSAGRSRRRFLGAAVGAAAGAALGFVPDVVIAQAPLTLRWQSAWPAKDIFHEYALDYARRVGEMSGGRLKIEMLPAGAVVKPFDLLDAVSKGTLDGAHAVTTYWYAKNPALALWGSGPAFGMDGNTLLAWHYHGGGAALLEEIYRSLRLEVVSLLYGPMPNQPLGWFRKPVTRPEDFKGLKYRTVGLSMDIFAGLGAHVNALSADEIVPALERGLLDAAEFNNASSDRLLGFPAVAAVCMLQSFHQPAEQLELLFNRRKFDALPAELKAIVRYGAESASADMSWKAMDRYSRDYQEMDRQGVRFMKTPEVVLQAQLRVWDEVAAKRAADNPFFARVLESQRAFARRCVRWQNDTFADSRLAWRHFFGAKA